jgi:hypothetical protein
MDENRPEIPAILKSAYSLNHYISFIFVNDIPFFDYSATFVSSLSISALSVNAEWDVFSRHLRF